MKTLLAILVVAIHFLMTTPTYAQESAGREFIMSCTYGVLAGTLVGAATLAFEDKPGDNLNKVARGASLGLYAGILLGLYVIYVVPEQDEDPDLYQQPGYPPPESRIKKMNEPRWALVPMISERGIEGMGGILEVMRF